MHKEQKTPENLDWANMKDCAKCVSFDGDADRQIYFYTDEDENIKILDGDKQFAIILTYIKGLLNELGIDEEVSHIFVHSPYTNLKAHEYLAEKGIDAQVVKTGVKNAHPVIVNYDIGANNEPKFSSRSSTRSLLKTGRVRRKRPKNSGFYYRSPINWSVTRSQTCCSSRPSSMTLTCQSKILIKFTTNHHLECLRLKFLIGPNSQLLKTKAGLHTL